MKNLTMMILIAITLTSANGQRLLGQGKSSNGIHQENEESKITGQDDLNLYPNPANRNIHVAINSSISTKATFKVMDVLGKNIVTEKVDLIEGSNNITVELSELQSGIYFINVDDGNTMHLSQRFTKQ